MVHRGCMGTYAIPILVPYDDFESFIPFDRLPFGISCITYFHLLVLISQHAGVRDENGNPIIKDHYSSPLTARYTSLV